MEVHLIAGLGIQIAKAIATMKTSLDLIAKYYIALMYTVQSQ